MVKSDARASLSRTTFALGLALLASSCVQRLNYPESTAFAAPSPDGSAWVVVTQINTPAGSSFKYEVSVHLQEEGESSASEVLWRSNGCGPIYTFWVTDRLIELHVAPEGEDPNCTEVVREAKRTRYSWRDYEVRVVSMRSYYKRDLMNSGDD